jgi:hypothetical protein
MRYSIGLGVLGIERGLLEHQACGPVTIQPKVSCAKQEVKGKMAPELVNFIVECR